MVSRTTVTSTAPFFCLNLVFFNMVSATYYSPPPATCSTDTLKLGVWANVLNLGNVVVGSPPTMPCCSLIANLVDLEAAVCLCTAIKANVLGINLDVPVSLSVVLNNCGKKVPNGFQCA